MMSSWGPRGQIDGLVQDSSISTANALEILQSCTKPSKMNQGFLDKVAEYNDTILEQQIQLRVFVHNRTASDAFTQIA